MKITIISTLIGFVLGGFLVYKYQTPIDKIVTKDVIKERIVTKTLPNGTIYKTEIITDTRESTHTKPIIVNKKYFAGAGFGIDKSYEAFAGKKLIGPLSVYGRVDSNKNLSVGLMMEF